MKRRGCAGFLIYLGVLFLAFGFSSYFWFKFFVRGSSIETPGLIGRAVPSARALASDAGLVMVVDNAHDRNSAQVPVGSIVWQNRAPGSLIKRGTRVYVGQSLGPLVLAVPDLTGESTRTALLRFSQRNLRLGGVAYLPLSGKPGVAAQDPPVGTVVPGQTAVSLLVATPLAPVSYVMPDLIDRPLDLVRPLLEGYGMTISNVRYETYPGIPDGIIIRQFPLNGSKVTTHDPITLVVSRGEGNAPVSEAPQE